MQRIARVAATGAISAALWSSAYAAPPSSGQLLRDLESMRVVGSVLYVAAHPDDENTRLIAYLEGARGLDVTYLSLTRGGGGQNLVGTEQSDLLSVVRTGELLGARAIDGGSQRFTRARDFGYSKSSDEALSSWGHDAVLEDVVRVVREVRPDVIITRFPTEGQTHGHHLASAILAGEAFEKAADPSYVIEGLEPWQADFLVRNESSWNISEDTDTSGWIALDVGGYDALTGRSWGEVAADARTMHKSQGFGSAPQYGPQIEYFSAVAGNVPKPGSDLFAGLDLTWLGIQGGAAVDKTLAKAAKKFDPRAPERSLPLLAQAHVQLMAMSDSVWKTRKLRDLEALMLRCAGVLVTARSKAEAVVPGTELDVELTVLMRNPADVTVRGYDTPRGAPEEGTRLNRVPAMVGVQERLKVHAPWVRALPVATAAQGFTRPHWLEQPATDTLFAVDPAERTLPERPPALVVPVGLLVAGRPIVLPVPIEYAWTDPVLGERIHPVEVLPAVTATFGQQTRLVPVGSTVSTTVTLRASAGPAEGVLKLTAPAGTTVTPAEVPFSLTADAPEQAVPVELSVGSEPGALVATVSVDGSDTSFDRTVIDHPHLPRRTVLRPARVELVPVALDRGATTRVAYLPGPGDAVPTGLRDLGYTVDLVDLDTVRSGGLASYDTLVLGIRAYNTVPALLDNRALLHDWVAAGGRLIVQYNTSNRWSNLGDFGPKPIAIGRDRVTDQTAALTPVDPKSPVLTGPNALTANDFDGWVQERGLYFAETWDPAYRPVFRTHDAGEDPLEGSLLVLRHGKGTFVYTGLSFFRQLPAGVPGAARLLANVLAVEAPE
ncbi:MAG: PIG-L family deacetylase [Myxococcota bacterium]